MAQATWLGILEEIHQNGLEVYFLVPPQDFLKQFKPASAYPMSQQGLLATNLAPQSEGRRVRLGSKVSSGVSGNLEIWGANQFKQSHYPQRNSGTPKMSARS